MAKLTRSWKGFYHNSFKLGIITISVWKLRNFKKFKLTINIGWGW